MLWLEGLYFSEEERDGVGWGMKRENQGEELKGKARRRGNFDWTGKSLIDQLIENKNYKL